MDLFYSESGIVVIILMLLGGRLYIVRRPKNIPFAQVEEQYFHNFNVTFPNPEKYSFESFDAYCMEDKKLKGVLHYFIHAKYRAYIDILREWDDIDEVSYGDNGEIENTYCLSWDSIEGFEDVNEEFNKALKEGIHKTYTTEEIENLIKNNKAKDLYLFNSRFPMAFTRHFSDDMDCIRWEKIN